MNKQLYKTCVQRKLDLNNKDVQKNEKNLNHYVQQQPKYRPPAMNGPSAGNYNKTRGVSEAAKKLGNMSIGGRPLARRTSVPPQPMKAGGWHGQSKEFNHERAPFTDGKVAG